MALRVCISTLRRSLSDPRAANLSASFENALLCLGTGTVGHNLVGFPPARFIASHVFLDRMVKNKPAESEDNLTPLPASVLPNKAEQTSLLVKNPNQPLNPKILKVAIIGSPNAGKSTLSNQLLGTKVFAVSKKVHTTVSRAQGVLTEEDTQIILLDTPGLTTASKAKKHQLNKSILVDPRSSVQQADLVVVLVDVSEKWSRHRLDSEVLKCLAQNQDIPSVLVLNKVDLLKNKPKLLDITVELTEGIVNGNKLTLRSVGRPPGRADRGKATEALEPKDKPSDGAMSVGVIADRRSQDGVGELKNLQGWPHFKDVFMLSAVDEEEVETLKRYLMEEAKPGPWQYHSDVLTDQSPEDICANVVREKLLEHLPQEVPYSVTQSIELWQELETGELDIIVKLHVQRPSHMKMLIGPAGQMIAKMAQEAGQDLTRLFLREVRLRLTVKLRN